MQISIVTVVMPPLTLALSKRRHIFSDGVFYPIMERGDTCVDAWKAGPRTAISGRDNSSQNPLVLIPAYHRATRVILKQSTNLCTAFCFVINYIYFCYSINISIWQVFCPPLAGADPGFPVGGGANIWFCQILRKTAWNWENFGPWGGGW